MRKHTAPPGWRCRQIVRARGGQSFHERPSEIAESSSVRPVLRARERSSAGNERQERTSKPKTVCSLTALATATGGRRGVETVLDCTFARLYSSTSRPNDPSPGESTG